MRSTIVLLITLLLPITAITRAEDAIQDSAGKHLDILKDGKPVVRYMYAFDNSTPETRHETYKVYHHVLDPAGKEFITKGSGGQYTHHRGIFVGFARLEHGGKTHDLWHMKGNCNLIHQKFLSKQGDKNSATVSSLIHWDIDNDKTIIEEKRTLTVYYTDSEAHLLADWTSELTAVSGAVLLKGDPEHAGVQYRPHNDVSKNKSAKYTFQNDGIDPRKDKDQPWVALTYKLGDATYSVQHMRHPKNPSDSVYSAYRDYGRFGNYFVKPIADGETLTLRYRFRITLGDTPTREALNQQYEKFVGE
jgi:hypothetical protein